MLDHIRDDLVPLKHRLLYYANKTVCMPTVSEQFLKNAD